MGQQRKSTKRKHTHYQQPKKDWKKGKKIRAHDGGRIDRFNNELAGGAWTGKDSVHFS